MTIRYTGPTGDVTDPESIALVAAYRARTAVPVALYADGGVVGQNPSPIGGTWAWCQVDAEGNRIRQASGLITPAGAQLPAITNNLTELLALVDGLEKLPDGWAGTVYSDSQVSLLRVFCAAKLNNVPRWLARRLHAIQRTGRLEPMTWQLLDGHPTKAQLEAGYGKRGNPVSVHNVHVDELCRQEAMKYREAVRDA